MLPPPLLAEACQLKPHRHLPDGALLHFKQQFAKSHGVPAPTPHQHTNRKERSQTGSCPGWRHSEPCFLPIHAQYWHEPLTSAELVLAGRSWVWGGGIDLKGQPMSRTVELYSKYISKKKCYQKNKNEASSVVSISLPFNPLRMRSVLNSSWRGFRFKAKSNSGLGNHKSHNSGFEMAWTLHFHLN